MNASTTVHITVGNKISATLINHNVVLWKDSNSLITALSLQVKAHVGFFKVYKITLLQIVRAHSLLDCKHNEPKAQR